MKRGLKMEVEKNLRFLLDTEEIRNLARRYAHYVWQCDGVGASGLFAVDGVMDPGDRPAFEGRATIREAYVEIFAESEFRPFVHNHVLDIQGDVATGTCYLDLKANVDDKLMVGWGYYDDDYVREDGHWLFERRRLTMVHYGEEASG